MKSPEVQIAAVKQNGWAIDFIKNPSPEVQMAAVKQNGEAIRCIENPSPEVQMAAVNQDGEAIIHIKNPSPEMQLVAVKQNGGAIRFIKNPSPLVVKYLKACHNTVLFPQKEIIVDNNISKWHMVDKVLAKIESHSHSKVINWCYEQFGNSWIMDTKNGRWHYYNHSVHKFLSGRFYFRNSEDAVLFILRWS